MALCNDTLSPACVQMMAIVIWTVQQMAFVTCSLQQRRLQGHACGKWRNVVS